MYKRVKNIKKEKPFYIWDLVILACVIAILGAFLGVYLKPDGKWVEIYVDGKLEYSYSINDNREIAVDGEGHNIVVIKDGAVYVMEADCPEQTCVKNKAISKSGEQIVCLPNKVVIVITGEREDGLDA